MIDVEHMKRSEPESSNCRFDMLQENNHNHVLIDHGYDLNQFDHLNQHLASTASPLSNLAVTCTIFISQLSIFE